MNDTPPAKKSLGQHWLRDTASLEAICDAADVQADDCVLEIGPGLGTLTEVLVRRAGQVIAVEFDEKLARQLPERVTADNLEVVRQDILGFDLTSLPPDYKLVANIPYYLTSNLIRVISETPNRPVSAAILVQKEVAERVAARPGGMSLLSVTAQFYWEVSLGREVPAELFEPPPKVDSRVLILQRRDGPLYPGVDPKQFFRLAKAGFGQRRKTLLNSLGGGLHLSRQETEKLLQTANIAPNRRAQTLSLDEWHALYRAAHT
ncbi:MAG TPA: 16S rRNA (adenine(1518)-N(6)/adenine(1519)-N(6))-dimethyltransferase RsmA [Candidatus Saccharimonadales bacterium]|nr:16S rRNA (adenine(1518)-N(6)/adenine(1519)-N(6))-dimethyltransferase RsmA [Candidatus Saccharimonadales bacterium]